MPTCCSPVSRRFGRQQRVVSAASCRRPCARRATLCRWQSNVALSHLLSTSSCPPAISVYSGKGRLAWCSRQAPTGTELFLAGGALGKCHVPWPPACTITRHGAQLTTLQTLLSSLVQCPKCLYLDNIWLDLEISASSPLTSPVGPCAPPRARASAL